MYAPSTSSVIKIFGCPKGHSVQQSPNPMPWTCDDCKSSYAPYGTSTNPQEAPCKMLSLRCWVCDYDSCQQCWGKLKPMAVLPKNYQDLVATPQPPAVGSFPTTATSSPRPQPTFNPVPTVSALPMPAVLPTQPSSNWPVQQPPQHVQPHWPPLNTLTPITNTFQTAAVPMAAAPIQAGGPKQQPHTGQPLPAHQFVDNWMKDCQKPPAAPSVQAAAPSNVPMQSSFAPFGAPRATSFGSFGFQNKQ